MSPVWNPDLLIGNSQIDDQHKRIFQIVEKLARAVAEHRGHEEVGGVLATASMFVVSHFKLEEDLMVQFEFPGLASHRKAHEAVRAQIEGLVDQFYAGGLDSMELVAFMETWLHSHIEHEDRPLADFLNSQEEAAS